MDNSDFNSSRRAVVAHHEVRSLRLLLLGQLAAGALLDGLMPPRARSRGAQGLVGDDGDRVVEDRLHAGLEQQGHLDHSGGRGRLAGLYLGAPLQHPLTHSRPQEALQPLAVSA